MEKKTQKASASQASTLSAILTPISAHERWKKLTKINYTVAKKENKNYFEKRRQPTLIGILILRISAYRLRTSIGAWILRKLSPKAPSSLSISSPSFSRFSCIQICYTLFALLGSTVNPGKVNVQYICVEMNCAAPIYSIQYIHTVHSSIFKFFIRYKKIQLMWVQGT